MRQDACTECHVVEEVNPYSSQEGIGQPCANQEKNDKDNTRKMDVREGAIGGF